MDKMAYLAMSGAKQMMLRQASINHNLANLDTVGFRADMDAFNDLPVYGPGQPTRVYVNDERVGIDLAPGKIIATGRDLDVAINGEGFIAVQAPDGAEAYTRAGDLQVDANGLLRTGTGLLVLGEGGPIAIPPYERIEVGGDGTISIQPLGQAASALTGVERIKLVKPEGTALKKRDDGLLEHRDGAVLPADAEVRLSAGVLESSNVNPVEALVNMIETARLYEMNVRLMTEAEENDAASARLMQVR